MFLSYTQFAAAGLDVDIPALLRIVNSPAEDSKSRDSILAGIERLCVLTDIPAATWTSGRLHALAFAAVADSRVEGPDPGCCCS